MKEEDKFKILIAEIDTRLLMNLEMVAREEDINVITCKDGLDALNLARKEMPDVLIIDVNIPGLKAFHVCNLLKLDDRFRDIRIIMLTNVLSRDYEEKASRTGIFELLVKPFTNDEFLPHLQMAIGRCRWRGQKMIFLQTK
jgi:two-component system alkaline phosphatase synthesis response regulator PhoP